LARFTALFDACVLYPQTTRDLLLSLARSDLFRARWSDRINEEWTRARLQKKPDAAEQIAYTLRMVNESVEDCLITGYEYVIPDIMLPDPDDRHVVAAAIVGRVDVIVTTNLADFPTSVLAPYEIEAQHPDEFVVHQFGINPAIALPAIKAMRARFRKPAMTASEFLDHLERKGFVQTAELLRPEVGSI
jgi:hypothetical protein